MSSNLFNFGAFGMAEILTFFAVLVRYSILMSVLPFVGDRTVPGPVKILLALAVSLALFPALVYSGKVKPIEAVIWGKTASGIISTIGLEALVGLSLGFTAKLVFDGVAFGANLMGNFMGFASASVYDPHQESQTEVIAQIQTTLAMLLFLALDGHHMMLRASLDSYSIVGIGKAAFSAALAQRVLSFTGEVFHFGLQLAAPVAVSMFVVNVVFGVISKSMPQINILVLSFSVTALVGLIVMFISNAQFSEGAAEILLRVSNWIDGVLLALGGR